MLIIIAAIIMVLMLFAPSASSSSSSLVRSSIDSQVYRVLDLPDKQLAADRLARLRAKMEAFLKTVPITQNVKFKPVLYESVQDSEYTSYTVNKGSEIHMCLRERDENNRFIDENTLFFVALHELSHVITVSIGHTDEFWNNFRMLLDHAVKGGYYKYHAYHVVPQKYCGLIIKDTPLKSH
jgi:hypothetical protein